MSLIDPTTQQATLTTNDSANVLAQIEAALVFRIDVDLELPGGWTEDQTKDRAREIIRDSEEWRALREITSAAAQAFASAKTDRTRLLIAMRKIGNDDFELLAKVGDVAKDNHGD